MLQTIYYTVAKTGYFLFIVLLFLFIYAIIGKEIYAFKLSFADDLPKINDFDFDTVIFKQGYPPD